MFDVPVLHQWHTLRTSHPSRTRIVQVRRPPERDTFGRQHIPQRFISEERFNLLRELKAIVMGTKYVSSLVETCETFLAVIPRREIGVVHTDIDVLRMVVWR